MELSISEERLKELLKTAIVELIVERRDLFHDLVEDIMEDIYLGAAMEEAEQTEFVSREEVFKLLKRDEQLAVQKVRYVTEVNGKLVVIENVPARVNLETGEQLFSPETVERLQQMIWEQREPDRVMEMPIFEFAA